MDWSVIFGKSDDEQPHHKLVGSLGVALFSIYLIFSILSNDFREIAIRFINIFTAITKDKTLSYSLAPLYINWIATDYFQERQKTRYGNAATNGFTGIWIGIYWIFVAYSVFKRDLNLIVFIGKVVIAFLMLVYGGVIIKEAIKGNEIAHIIGRVREVSYFAIMITPLIYGIIKIDLVSIAAIIVFYPLFYGIVEFIEFILLPKPVTDVYQEKEDEKKGDTK